MNNCEMWIDSIPVLAHQNISEALNSVFSGNEGDIISGFAIAINPEKIIAARRDVALRNTLKSATLRFADGIGIVYALRMKGARHAERIPGIEFWIALMQKAGEINLPVFLVGAKSDVLRQVQKRLVDEFSTDIVGAQDGYFYEFQKDELIQRIKNSGARIVTVAMGSPRQEVFITQCRQVYPDAFYIGVGGAYDVFAGKVRRAPPWACKLNIEWLYRLVSDPSRLFRQLKLVNYLLLLLFRKL